METPQLNDENKYQFYVTMIAVILISAGLTSLIERLYHISDFSSVSSSWLDIKMRMNTIICFILSGFALLFSLSKSGRGRIIIFTIPMIILLIGSITVLEVFFGMNLGIDQLFTKGFFTSETQYADRRLFITAFNFIFVALAFVLNKHRAGLLSQIFAILVLFTCLFAFYNHVFDANINYGIAAYTTMTVYTILLFTLLSVGILLVNPGTGITEILLRDAPVGYYFRRLLLIILFVPMSLELVEKTMEKMKLLEPHLGDSIVATGIFVILSLVVTILIRRMDREEVKLKSAQTQVHQEKTHLHNRDDILQLIENETTINEAGPKILKMICQMYNWKLGEIWLIDEKKQILRFVNNWHTQSDKINQYNKISCEHTFKFGEGLPGMIWQQSGTVWIPDYSKRREFSRSFDAEKAGLHCAFGMPIVFQGHIFGIMGFFSSIVHTPNEAMLCQMKNVGKLMGEFIHRVHTNDQIQSLSRRDILTGLLNRSAIEEDLNDLIFNTKLEVIAILIVDIDKFKPVNEALGDDKGDLIIKLAAKKLEKLSNHDNTHVARLGADKFILYYIAIKNTEDVVDYAHKIERNFKEPFSIDKKEIFLTVSIGISIYPQDGADSKTLIENADQALTYAKKDGGNKSIFFTKELSDIALEKLELHIDLHQAITKNQFLIHYQPQIDLISGDICGAEALVRWQHPTKGMISPADFISYAEQTGLIIPLNEHIMRIVFQQVKSDWPGPPIALNISSKQFKDKYHLVEYVESLMNEFSVNPKNIEFEITESLLMEKTKHNIAVLGALRQMGFQFAIDDFGTGFSSLSYLYRIPAHKIKIDKSFITGLPDNQANAEIVRSMIAMLHSLGKKIVAEGAETETEIEFLKNEKCDIIQGYYYYKPMSTDDFIALITKINDKRSTFNKA